MYRAGFSWLCVRGRGGVPVPLRPIASVFPYGYCSLWGWAGGYLLSSRYMGISGPLGVPRIPDALLCVLRWYGDSSGPLCLGHVGRIRGVLEEEYCRSSQG